MSDPFKPEDFTDGSRPGSDPYDNLNGQYQRPALWSSRETKAEGANAVAAFLVDPNKDTFALAEDGLMHLTGWGNLGSYQNYDDPRKLATLAGQLKREHPHHDLSRARLWCDVEDAFKAWLDSSGIGDRIVTAGDDFIEQRERAVLRNLLAKYPDEVTIVHEGDA